MTKDDLIAAMSSVHRLLEAAPGTLEMIEIFNLGLIFGEVSKWLAEKEAEQAMKSCLQQEESEVK